MAEGPDLIIIRGAPGAGKTTLSKDLMRFFPGGATIETDNIRDMVNDKDHFLSTRYEKRLSIAASLCVAYLTHGYRPVILVDTMNNSSLDSFLKKFAHYRISGRTLRYRVISLYCDSINLQSRITTRGRPMKDIVAVQKFNEDMKIFRHDNDILLDTTGLDSQKVLEMALNAIGIEKVL